jgi:hypothetical protein
MIFQAFLFSSIFFIFSFYFLRQLSRFSIENYQTFDLFGLYHLINEERYDYHHFEFVKTRLDHRNKANRNIISLKFQTKNALFICLPPITTIRLILNTLLCCRR